MWRLQAFSAPVPGMRRAEDYLQRPVPRVREARLSSAAALVEPRTAGVGECAPLSDLVAKFGASSPSVSAALRIAVEGLSETTDRDAIAQQLVEGLSFVYPNTILLLVKLPRLQIWNVRMGGSSRKLVGKSFDIKVGSMWDQVTTDGNSYLGSLDSDDPLGSLLSGLGGSQFLIFPICVNRRPVAVAALNAGAMDAPAAPGQNLLALEMAAVAAFKRVIFQNRKAGHHPV